MAEPPAIGHIQVPQQARTHVGAKVAQFIENRWCQRAAVLFAFTIFALEVLALGVGWRTSAGTKRLWRARRPRRRVAQAAIHSNISLPPGRFVLSRSKLVSRCMLALNRRSPKFNAAKSDHFASYHWSSGTSIRGGRGGTASDCDPYGTRYCRTDFQFPVEVDIRTLA